MPRFSANMLQQVKNIDILTFIAQYVDLKNAGRSYVGLCPFHNEKTGSFHVLEDKGFFNCFGCGAKGDIIEFAKRKFGFSFHDAVIFLAEGHNISIEYADGLNFAIQAKEVYDIHQDILEIARRSLYSAEGSEARRYIYERGFDDQLANDFMLGYLPGNVDYSLVIEKYGVQAALDTGFFKQGNYDRLVPRFFNRLVLPIKSLTGQIIAFAGRSLDGGMPKYLNSAEGLLFHKGSTLFNIDSAKDYIKKSGIAIIVEGYFDVIRLYSVGVKNVVAPMGTALTKEQISMLRRYASEIVVIFDGDQAGQKAANRSLENFVEHSIFPNVVFLPKDEDPDSFILKHGRQAFDIAFEKREDLFINRCTSLANSCKGNFKELVNRFELIKKLLAKSSNRHLEAYYTDLVSVIFSLKEENVYKDIEEERLRYKRANEISDSSLYICEKDFLTALSGLPVKDVLNITSSVPIDMIMDAEMRSLYENILRELNNIEDMSELGDKIGGKYTDIAMRMPLNRDKSKIYSEALINRGKIELNFLKRSIRNIDNQMEGIDTNAKIELIKNKHKLLEKSMLIEREINSLNMLSDQPD